MPYICHFYEASSFNKLSNSIYMYFKEVILSVLFVFTIIFSGAAQYTESEPIMNQKVFKKFIRNHIEYPEYDLEKGIQGTVKIKFTTNMNGVVTNSHILQSVSPGIDSAALALFNLIIWKPATSMGRPIENSSEFQIKYNIKNFRKVTKRRGYKHILPPTITADSSNTIFTQDKINIKPQSILKSPYKSLNQYIYENLTYPDAALKLGLSGDVTLAFVIEKSGLPSNIVAEKQLGGGCTEEAIRIIESIKWKPGVLNNKTVRTYYHLTIKFKKNENSDIAIPNQQGSGI